ncbi:MAG: hypothetical protein HY697_02735 [Deltaproteobacteria bacterium]|nr:hypothetical protein [Deltaproteobacteria bacterium]
MVQTLSLAGPRRVEISLPAEGSPRPEEVLERIFAWPEGERPACSILKTQVQFKDTHHVQRDLDQHQFR